MKCFQWFLYVAAMPFFNTLFSCISWGHWFPTDHTVRALQDHFTGNISVSGNLGLGAACLTWRFTRPYQAAECEIPKRSHDRGTMRDRLTLSRVSDANTCTTWTRIRMWSHHLAFWWTSWRVGRTNNGKYLRDKALAIFKSQRQSQ